MRFTPDAIRVKPGETVRFVVRNVGKVEHEMVIGTAIELKDWPKLDERVLTSGARATFGQRRDAIEAYASGYGREGFVHGLGDYLHTKCARAASLAASEFTAIALIWWYPQDGIVAVVCIPVFLSQFVLLLLRFGNA